MVTLERIKSDDFYIGIVKYDRCQCCGQKTTDTINTYVCGKEFWQGDYKSKKFKGQVAKVLGVIYHPTDEAWITISAVLADSLRNKEEFYEYLEVLEKIKAFINPEEYEQICRAICGVWDYMQISTGEV